jgi:hypothetical protein
MTDRHHPFRRRPLAAALALPLLAVLGAPAHAAVGVAPDGVGQVLVYPYYSVNSGNNTVVSVINTTGRAKALAVRFREARNGRIVLSFNAYLAPHDTWVGAITAPGATGPAQLTTNDTSCTVPAIPPAAVPFRNFDYTGGSQDHPDAAAAVLGSLERTREGYIEVFEVGELSAGGGSTQLAEEVVANATGVPANCAAVVSAWVAPSGVWATNPATDIGLPGGGLRGAAAIIDVADGTMYSYAATAITGFYTDALAPGALHLAPSSARPQLSDARTSAGITDVVVIDETGAVLTERYAGTAPNADPVSLALMRSRLNGEHVIDPALGASTEWVLTFPTKNAYVNGAQPLPPFTTRFPETGRAPERLVVAAWDRTGRSHGAGVGDCSASAGCAQPVLPNSSNVLAITRQPDAAFGGVSSGPTPILGATIGATATSLVLPTSAVGTGGSSGLQPFGQIDLAFGDRATTSAADPTTSANVLTGPSGRRYFGLPVIALSFARYVNGTLGGGVLSNYGAETHVGASLVTRP